MRGTLGLLVSVLLGAAAFVACAPGGVVIAVTIEDGDLTLVPGDALTLVANVTTSGRASSRVAWGSSDETVATIGHDGTLVAVAPGSTEIVAASAANPDATDKIHVAVEPLGQLRGTVQFGTPAADDISDVAANAAGIVHVVGWTSGDLEGTNQGAQDAFVRVYDDAGAVLWTRQFGTAVADRAHAVTVDTAGNVLVVGTTAGALAGSSIGGNDGFVRSFAPNGDLRWTHQFGSGANEAAYGVTTDGDGHVYVVGSTAGTLDGQVSSGGPTDAFVLSLDAAGDVRWTRQFGTAERDSARGIAFDHHGRVLVVGTTEGSLEGPAQGNDDAFARSFDTEGTPVWTRQYGTSDLDSVRDVAIDAAGNAYIAGHTFASLGGPNAGEYDVYVRSLDASGTERWTVQFGTASTDDAVGIATDRFGNVFVTGRTEGALVGAGAGSWDAFVRSLDKDGEARWTRQFGTVAADEGAAVATDGVVDVYVAGRTLGDLEGTNTGSSDGYVRTFGR